LKEPIYHRQEFDTDGSWKAFQDFLNLPSHCRDVPTLLELYTKQAQDRTNKSKRNTPPTTSNNTLSKWCSVLKWNERARAADAAEQIILDMEREVAKKVRIQRQVEQEQAQVEEFRNAILGVGKGIVQFGAQMMTLMNTVTSEFKGKTTLTDADLEKLSKVAYIYRSTVSGGIPIGQEAWAQALGIEEAIAVLGETKNDG